MRIINLSVSDEVDYVYIGRAVPEYGLAASALGNPFTLEKYSREEAIEKYRRWLWDKIKAEDAPVLAALRALEADSVLACWCKPEACHGDVVMATWVSLRKNRPELLE